MKTKKKTDSKKRRIEMKQKDIIQIGDIILYSVKELEKMTGISKFTLRKYVREGKLPVRRIGKYWYASMQDVNDFVFKYAPVKGMGGNHGEKQKK